MTCLVWTGDNEDDDYFSSLFKKEDTLGDPIREKLAIVVDKSLSAFSDMEGEKVSSLLEKYKRPSNNNNILTRISATHFPTCL